MDYIVHHIKLLGTEILCTPLLFHIWYCIVTCKCLKRALIISRTAGPTVDSPTPIPIIFDKTVATFPKIQYFYHRGQRRGIGILLCRRQNKARVLGLITFCINTCNFLVQMY